MIRTILSSLGHHSKIFAGVGTLAIRRLTTVHQLTVHTYIEVVNFLKRVSYLDRPKKTCVSRNASDASPKECESARRSGKFLAN